MNKKDILLIVFWIVAYSFFFWGLNHGIFYDSPDEYRASYDEMRGDF